MNRSRGKGFTVRALMAFALLLAVIVSLVVLHLRRDEARVAAMKCFRLGEQELRDRLETLRANLMPRPAAEMQHVVLIRFVVDFAWGQGDTLAIRSHRADKIVYLGPFATAITVSVDSALSTDDGYDVLSFTLFRSDSGQMCLWSGDLGFPFWGRAKEVTVRLLSERRIDENGIVRTYDVDLD